MTFKHKDQVTELLNRRRSGLAHIFKILYIVGELLIINVSLIAALFIIYDRTNTSTFDKSLLDYLRTAPFLSLAAFLYIDYLGMTHFFRKNRVDVVSAGIQLVFLTTITGAAIAYFGTWFSFSRYSMALGGILMLVLTCAWSLICLELSKHIYSKGKLLIVAVSKDDADRMYMKVCGQLKTLHINYLGYTIMDHVPRVLRLVDKSTEVMVSSAVSESDKSQLYLYCADRDKTVYVVPQFSDLIYTKFRVVQFEDMPTFMIDSLGLTFQQRVLKRTFDVIFSLLAIVLTTPLQLVIGLLVKMDSKGPALYSQDRITRSGRIYNVYKFRTMEDEAEEKYGAFQSSLDDPRVTRIGKFLRNTHIDELPQFFNILKGDMSVVGPRSDRPTTIGEFEDSIPGYNQRLKVKAGLTGLAQISGKYNTSPEDKLSFDMMYIKNYSFLIDMKIVLQTIWAMIPSRRNYNIMDGDFENWEFVPKK
jgi:exopolysaccharide biosynthesis polyprenyl glycosylphosphotransferase